MIDLCWVGIQDPLNYVDMALVVAQSWKSVFFLELTLAITWQVLLTKWFVHAFVNWSSTEYFCDL